MPQHPRFSIQRRGLIAAVACIALLGSIGMELLGGMMRDAQGVRLQLVEISALVNRQSALEGRAVATEGREEAIWAAIAANDSAIGYGTQTG